MKDSIELIKEERENMIAELGSVPKKDNNYNDKELLDVSLAYINKLLHGETHAHEGWPFMTKYYKDEGYIKNLARLGAIISFELDRVLVN